MKENNFITLEVKSEGSDVAYTRHLERALKHRTQMMWWAWAGWVITAIAYIYQ